MLERSSFSLQQKLLVCLLLLAFATTTVTAQQPTGVEQPPQAVNTSADGATDKAEVEAMASQAEVVTNTGRAEKSHYFTLQYVQRYDDNVLLKAGDRSGEMIYIPQVGFGISKVDSRNLLRLDYLGGREIHNGYPAFSGALHNLAADWRHTLSKRLTIFTSERYLQRPVTVGFNLFGQDASIPTPTVTTLTPTKLMINDLGGGINYRLDKVSTLEASYYYIISRYTNPTLVDTDEQRLALDYARQVSRRRTYGLAYNISYFTGSGNLVAQSVLPTWRYRTAHLSLRLGAGPQWTNSSRIGDTFSWTALADLKYEQARTTYTVSYNTGTGTGGGFAAVTRNHTIFGTVIHEFNSRWSMENRVGFNHARNLTTQVATKVASTVPTGTISAKEIEFESRINYLVGERTSAFVSYLYTRQLAATEISSGTGRNIISLGFSFDTRRSKRTRTEARF